MNRTRIMLGLFILVLFISGVVAASNGKGVKQLAQSEITVDALKGPVITDLMIHASQEVTTAKKITVKAYNIDGTSKFTRNFMDVGLVNGTALLQFDDLQRGELVDVSVHLDEGLKIDNSTIVLLRPDLVVVSAVSKEKVIAGETMWVNITVQEINNDRGAEAVVVLVNGDVELDTAPVKLVAGGATNANLSAVFTSAGNYSLGIKIMNSLPAEYDETNNVYNIEVRVVSPDLAITNVSAPAYIGIGQSFEVLANISELSGESGATATVTLTENNNVLDSRVLTLPAAGSGLVIFNANLGTAGEHYLTAKITSSVPADAIPENNEQTAVVRVVSADLAVTNVNAPSYVAIGQRFEVLAEISELYGYTGATATVALLEGSAVLDSKVFEVQANSSATIALNGSLAIAGTHNMTVRIIESVPTDLVPENNEQVFAVTAKKSPEPMLYALKYYYHNASYNISRDISDNGYAESAREHSLSEDEIISFTASSNRSMNFPVRVRVSITNETGEGNILEETNVVPTSINGSRKEFTKYYNETGALLTLTVDETGTSMSIEIRTNFSFKHSKGYTYWWFKGTQGWDITTNSSNGELIRANSSVQVNIELEDVIRFLGGKAVLSITNESYTGGWVDTSAGKFEEQRAVLIYSGNGSGETVI